MDISGVIYHPHYPWIAPGDNTADRSTERIQKDHPVSSQSDVRKEVHSRLDVDRYDSRKTEQDPYDLLAGHTIIRKYDRRDNNQDEAAHGIQYG